MKTLTRLIGALALILACTTAARAEYNYYNRGRLLKNKPQFGTSGTLISSYWSGEKDTKSHIQPGTLCHWEVQSGWIMVDGGNGLGTWEKPREKLVLDMKTDFEDQLEMRLFNNDYRGPL